MLIRKLQWKRIINQKGLKAIDEKTGTTYEIHKDYRSMGYQLIVNGDMTIIQVHQKDCKEWAQKMSIDKHRRLWPDQYGLDRFNDPEYTAKCVEQTKQNKIWAAERLANNSLLN